MKKLLPVGVKLNNNTINDNILYYLENKEIHIWNEDTTIWDITNICSQLKKYEYKFLNNIYLHINDINEISFNDISSINESGVILSLSWCDKYNNLNYIDFLSKFCKLNLVLNDNSIEKSFNKIKPIKLYYNMINNYSPGFTIDINNIKDGEYDGKILLNFINSKVIEERSIARHFLSDICNINDYIDMSNKIHSYKDIGCSYLSKEEVCFYYKNKLYPCNDYKNDYNHFYKKYIKKYNKCNLCNVQIICNKYKNCKEIKNFYNIISKYISEY